MNEFLDKELQRITRDATLGRRYADKLVKVYLKVARLCDPSTRTDPGRGKRRRLAVGETHA